MAKRILITNDDGIQAPALRILESELRSVAKTLIVAPDREMSGQSHAITINRPLRYREYGPNQYCVDGTPADCVIISSLKILDKHPDLVVSGINCGRNIGDAVQYSGTIAAASEAALQGIPGMAISLEYRESGMDFGPAAELAGALADRILKDGLPPGVILNVNVPAEWNGAVTLARQGDKAGRTVLVEGRDPRGAAFVWLHEESHEALSPPMEDLPTDIEALRAGLAAVTPLQLDRTAYQYVRGLSSWKDVLDQTRFLPKG
jgi:5'-nucleotidase